MQTRSKYLKQLEGLEASLARLAEKAAADVRAAGASLSGEEGAAEAAEAVLAGASVERRLRAEIERACLDIMLLQQPLVADDLRFVSGAFRAVSDIAHIDSMTRDVAYLSQGIPAEETAELRGVFAELSERCAVMVETAFDAFRSSSEERANEVYALDDEVDRLYHQAEAIVVGLIRSAADDAEIEFMPELFMVAKYFERMGDDAQRLADWAVFRATGEHEVYSVAHSKKGAEPTKE